MTEVGIESLGAYKLARTEEEAALDGSRGGAKRLRSTSPCEAGIGLRIPQAEKSEVRSAACTEDTANDEGGGRDTACRLAGLRLAGLDGSGSAPSATGDIAARIGLRELGEGCERSLGGGAARDDEDGGDSGAAHGKAVRTAGMDADEVGGASRSERAEVALGTLPLSFNSTVVAVGRPVLSGEVLAVGEMQGMASELTDELGAMAVRLGPQISRATKPMRVGGEPATPRPWRQISGRSRLRMRGRWAWSGGCGCRQETFVHRITRR